MIEKEETFLAIFFNPPEDAGFGFLQPAFRPHLPAWENVYGLGSAAPHSGRYIFKASLADHRASGSVWCRLAVPAEATLDQLANAVLRAFRFEDTEHLYKFQYRGHRGQGRVYNHPYCDDGPYALEVTVGAKGLPEKGTMKFMFDFGDDWRFALRLEGLEPAGKGTARIQILNREGKPPEQYPRY